MKFQKKDEGKPRPDLLPPGALWEISRVMEFGARKYSDNNWCQGADWSRYIAALERHILAWKTGEDNDPESGINHLAHAGCCLLYLLEYHKSGIGTDDRVGHAIAAGANAK